jgi:catalase
MTVTPEEATAAANSSYGVHPGRRALHAKGTLLKGTFTATPEAATLTRAAHMQGDPIPATIRVSNGGGNPDVPDYAPDVRGLAVKMYLPDETRTDIVAQTAPKFIGSTPDTFVDLLRAQGPGASVAWKFPLFLVRNPGALARLPANLPALRPPVSYATCTYYAVHAYRWVDPDGGGRFVRYTWRPEAGEHHLGPRAARSRGRDYLQDEIRQRVESGPVRFTLELQIAASGDNPDDPSAIWPKDRRRVNAGTLEVTGLETERETGGDVLVFDPTRVVDGIELSGDPVLKFRKAAYSDSVGRRMEAG